MIYQETLKARWHDTDASLAVRPSQTLVYMQEMAFCHLNSVNRNLDALRFEQGLAFILTRLTLKFYEPIHPAETITAQTWVSEGKGLNFPRYFRLKKADETVAAEAASSWLLINLNTRLPVRVSEFDYGFSAEDPLPFTTPRRLALPADMTEVGQRKIVYSDIDYNGHMNNTRYPDMICDYLPEDTVARIHTMHLEFVREAKYGSTLRVMRGMRVSEDGDTVYLVQTIDEQGEVCLVAEVWVK
jgi:acyl-CoA thioesterase FadM